MDSTRILKETHQESLQHDIKNVSCISLILLIFLTSGWLHLKEIFLYLYQVFVDYTVVTTVMLATLLGCQF